MVTKWINFYYNTRLPLEVEFYVFPVSFYVFWTNLTFKTIRNYSFFSFPSPNPAVSMEGTLVGAESSRVEAQ